MTCGSLAEIILDMARGAVVPESSRRGAERHMAGCPSCASEFARQAELTAALQALATDAQEWRAPQAMEQRLLEAFAARHVVAPSAPSASSPDAWLPPSGGRVASLASGAAGRWKYALPAAAALALALWGGLRLVREPPPAPAVSRTAESTKRETGELASGRTGELIAIGDPANGRPANPPSPSGLRRDRPRPRTPLAVSERTTQTSRTATSAVVEFVRIPSAIGLPDMESGTVVRMELPLTSLPEYGLDIAPDAARTSIEADVLVGQDGQPRAIRLVGIPDAVAPDSRSRQ